jgi:serine/threonine protein phosphatase PrpC
MLVLAPQQLHGSEYGISLRRGRRLSMEDRADAINAYGKNISLFAIYDGHGGADVAELLQAELLKRVASHLDEETGTQQEALVSSFSTLEKMADEMEQADQCGSTAVVALLDESTRQLHLSIAGNSIALLCSMEGPLLLTMPHELSLNEYELQRVRLAGGTVTDHSGGLKKRLAGDLELSRSFGDMRYRHLGLISTPEINRFDLREFQESSSLFLFLLLLSDGVVETLTYDEVCAHAKAQHLGLKRPAPSPPQPPPIVLPSGKISVWSRLMTWITHHLAGLSLPSQTGSLPHCCDCSPRSKCKELPRNRSAQSIAERVSVEAFNRGSSDNLAVIAINLAPPEPHDSLVLPGSLSYTLTTRLASLPSVLDPSVLHGHQSLFSVPYFQFGFWEHLLDDPSPLAMPDAIAMSEVIPCLGMNVGEGAIALRESMDVACSLFNELAVASSIALSLSERRSRVLLSFDGGDVSEKDEEGRERLGSGSFGSVWRAKSKGNHVSSRSLIIVGRRQLSQGSERHISVGFSARRMFPRVVEITLFDSSSTFGRKTKGKARICSWYSPMQERASTI